MLYGVDVHARYQGGLDIPLLARQGYTFLVSKASEGTGIPPLNGSSAAFKLRTLQWMDQARAAGMIPGLYHWIKSGNGAGQARFFHGIVKDAGGPGGMLIQLDCEDNATYSDVVAWAEEWQRLTGGHPFLIYTGGWWWRPRGWNGNVLTPYLWESHYLSADVDTIPDNPAQYSIPAAWWTPGYGQWPVATILQFTSRGDAGSLGNNIDLNAFRGSLADLQALAPGGTYGEDDTMFVKINGQDAVYQSRGDGYIHQFSPEALAAAEAAGYKVVKVANKAQLEALLGKPYEGVKVTVTQEQLDDLADAVAAKVLGPIAKAAKAESDVLAAETPSP